ncbi:hypothetical protein KRP22_002489 [Phytophthora ramorum]|nr:PA-phosphatase related-family protein [Phytophthora ramorum]
MTTDSIDHPNEKNEVVTTYQSMVPSPSSSAPVLDHSSTRGDAPGNETSVDITDAKDDAPPTSVLKQFMQNYRVLEFACTVLVYLLAFVFASIEVNERPIPGIRVRLNSTAVVWSLDPSLNAKKLSEEVPMWLLLVLGICLPVGTNLIINFVLPRFSQVRVIAHDTRDFLLSLFQSMALATLLAQFVKNITGRFRPSFYHMCKWNYDEVWDGVTNLCTDAAGEKEGRKSFPSGHASFAWATMLVLTVYLLGRSRLNCENRSNSTLRGGKKSLMLFMCCAPILLAAWVSVTRCIDNWHHYSDILAGSVIGAASALFAFNYNYGSIFSWDSAGLPLDEINDRRMYKEKEFHADKTLPNFDAQLKYASCQSENAVGLSSSSRSGSLSLVR